MVGIVCPIKDELWDKLVQKYGGNEVQAFKVWENNNYTYPDDIFSESAKDDIIENDIIEEDIPFKLEKLKIIESAQNTLKHKLKSLNRAANKHQHLEKITAETKKLLNDLVNYETDAAIIKFIQGSERMVNSSMKWLDSALEDPSKANAKNIKRIYESVSTLKILEDISDDFFDDPEYKEEFNKIKSILADINTIHNKYIEVSRKFLADQIKPDYTKIRVLYEEQAERKYNESKKKLDLQKGLSKKELEMSKKDYIYKYMTANKEKIELETQKAVEELLIQTSDISNLIRFIESPKDMHHDIINFATKILDKSDREIRNRTINKTYELEKLNDEYLQYVGVKSNPMDQYSELFEKDQNGNPLPILINPNSSEFTHFQEKNKNNAIGRLHTALLELANEKTKLVGNYNSIGYNLPKIPKTTLERATSGTLVNTLKRGIMDHFRITNEDTAYGNIVIEDKKNAKTVEVKTNISGKEREEIPIYYRNKMDNSDISFDIVTSFLMDYNNSLQYEARLENGLTLDILKDTVLEARIEKRNPGTKKLKIDKLTGQPLVESATDSKVVQVLNSLIRHRIYGISVEGDPGTAKILNTLKNFTSYVTLGGNLLSGTANYLQGQSVILIETAGGKGNRFGIKNRLNASAKFDKDLPNVLNDLGERTYKSKTNQLLQYFNVFSDYSTSDYRFINNNKLKKVTSSGSLVFANELGEYALQSTLMYSRFDNIKVIGKDGLYITKEYKSTNNRDEAMSIDEAISFNENNEISFDERVLKTELTDGLTENDMFKIEQDIRRINRDMFGNYDQLNKSELQRNAWGALVVQMRNWIIPGIQRRYKGIANFRTSTEDLDLAQRNFNNETNQFEEGTYTTAVKFLTNAFKGIKFRTLLSGIYGGITSMPSNWSNLTDYEKANMKKTMVEFGIAISALLLYYGLKGDDDDDKDQLLAIYLSRRLYSELISFANINETLRTFRSPAMATNTLESAIDLFTQATTDPQEVYETGPHKGEYKIKRKVAKLVPLWKQWDRNLKESLLFLEK